jgi:hypothetical protein
MKTRESRTTSFDSIAFAFLTISFLTHNHNSFLRLHAKLKQIVLERILDCKDASGRPLVFSVAKILDSLQESQDPRPTISTEVLGSKSAQAPPKHRLARSDAQVQLTGSTRSFSHRCPQDPGPSTRRLHRPLAKPLIPLSAPVILLTIDLFAKFGLIAQIVL